jgi:hypothetical protein
MERAILCWGKKNEDKTTFTCTKKIPLIIYVHNNIAPNMWKVKGFCRGLMVEVDDLNELWLGLTSHFMNVFTWVC